MQNSNPPFLGGFIVLTVPKKRGKYFFNVYGKSDGKLK